MAQPETTRIAPRSLSRLVLILVLSAGCTGRLTGGGAAAAEDVDFAKRYLALFQSRSFPAIEMGMDPAVKDPQIRPKLLQMASVFPVGEPTAVRLAGSSITRSGSTTTTSLSFEYEYSDRWVLAEVVVERKGQAPVIKGVHIQPLRESLERANRITLAGKGPAHYAAAAVAGIVLVFVFCTFVLVIRTPAPSMKWGWAIFVLAGASRFAFNWTTGVLSVNLMTIEWFGSGFTKASAFTPLVITTSIPVGAIVYLIQRREWRQDPGPPSEPPGSSEPAGPGDLAP
jgi:hypothetical protein